MIRKYKREGKGMAEGIVSVSRKYIKESISRNTYANYKEQSSHKNVDSDTYA